MQCGVRLLTSFQFYGNYIPLNLCALYIYSYHVDPYKEEIAILDSLYLGNHDENWKLVVEL